MPLTEKEKNKIKNYFLVTQGLNITAVEELYNYLLLKPYGAIDRGEEDLSSYQDINLEDLTQEIFLAYMNISDVLIFSRLDNLTLLDLSFNRVKDISPLSCLSNLKELYLGDNKIEDIFPLFNLKKLKTLYLIGNSYLERRQIKELKKHLPSCYIRFDT
jgi:Leucine-rich repeat (LRR) protein